MVDDLNVSNGNERYWQGKTEELGKKELFDCHFVHHIFHINWP
jgi:hypothetical protein